MPAGLADSLNELEFADLVAYLESLSNGKGKFGSGVSGPISFPDGFEIQTIATGLSGAVARGNRSSSRRACGDRWI
ncbi:MAG: hypothetical protein AB8B50_10680 [Pirellulaceae bacterium]